LRGAGTSLALHVSKRDRRPDEDIAMDIILRTAAFCAVLLAAGVCQAQTEPASSVAGYPSRPVRVIVPFAPGGVTDVMGRLLAQKLSENLGQQFYVENHAGAGGNIGTATAATQRPDGYTLVVTSSSYVVNPSLHAKVPYDPEKDFVPVTISGTSPNVLVVHPSVPAKSVKELVDYVRTTGKQSFASAGVGTTPHLSGELFRLSLGLDMVHVPFSGAGPALQSAVAGHTPIAFTALPPAVSLVKAGSLRALAATSAKRSSALPDVPTMAEAGFPGQEAETLLLVLAPAGTPKEIVARLYREIVKIVALPEVQQKFDALGFDPVAGTPEASAARIKEELARWAKVIRDAKIEQQ
jgi:tripartite-type tricarboxylate transporter receptor subunit TctC